jgi:hypothetical protein
MSPRRSKERAPAAQPGDRVLTTMGGPDVTTMYTRIPAPLPPAPITTFDRMAWASLSIWAVYFDLCGECVRQFRDSLALAGHPR